jgi:hypothetical protein
MSRPFPPETRTSSFSYIQSENYELHYITQDFIDKDQSSHNIQETMSSVDLPHDSPSPPSTPDEKLVAAAPKGKNPFAGKSGRFWTAYATLNLTAFISALDAVIIAAALPAITSELGGTSNQAFWSGTCFLLAATITQPLYGTFSEIFGRRINLMIALAWFMVGSIMCARSINMEMFLASRVVC